MKTIRTGIITLILLAFNAGLHLGVGHWVWTLVTVALMFVILWITLVDVRTLQKQRLELRPGQIVRFYQPGSSTIGADMMVMTLMHDYHSGLTMQLESTEHFTAHAIYVPGQREGTDDNPHS